MSHLSVLELAFLILEDPSKISALSTPDPGHEPRDRGAALLHLTACPHCRRCLRELLAVPPGMEGSDGLDRPMGLDLLFMATELARAGSLEELDPIDEAHPASNTADGSGKLRALLDLPVDQRVPYVEQSPEHRTPRLAGLLLREAGAAKQESRLVEARNLAHLAAGMLEALPHSIRLSRQLVLAYCLISDIELLRGELAVCEDLLGQAVRYAQDGSLLDQSRARLTLSLGRLRLQQGRNDEAIALFERSRVISETLGTSSDFIHASLSLGWLLIEEEEREEAAGPLLEAYTLLKGAPPSPDFVSVVHAMLLADQGDEAQQQELMAVLESLRLLPPSPLGDITVDRIKAQVAALEGRQEDSEAALRSIFIRLADLKLPFDAALAALELVRHLLASSAPDSLDFEDLREALDSLALPSAAGRVLRFVFSLFNFPESFYMEALLSAEKWLARSRHNPELPYFPLEVPESEISWVQLHEAEQHQAVSWVGVQVRRHPSAGTVDIKNASDREIVAWTYEARTGIRLTFSLNFEDDTDVL